MALFRISLGFLLVPGVAIAHIHMCLDRDKQVNNPDDQRGKECAQNRYAESGDDKLGQINDDGTDEKADDATIIG